jgi:CheY-like chemotaxis protein
MTETILVVDSNPMGLKLAAALLRAEGYEPRLASSGELALSMLVTLRPSAILVDLQLIGMEAWELARRIREDPLVSDTPVVAIAGAGTEDRHRIANTAAFRASISKPLDAKTLGVQLRKILAEGVNTAPIDYAAPTREAPPVQRTLPRRTAEGETEVADLTHEFLEDGYRHALALIDARPSSWCSSGSGRPNRWGTGRSWRRRGNWRRCWRLRSGTARARLCC